jgi:hypothetical protein
MKLMMLVAGFFWKRQKSSPFSDAIAEGIKDLFREMGYYQKRERDA